ncbi:MAG TPA: hypothetical protein VFD74_03170, partial [Thermoleophilia bacterium]|nr:hypothetical protein [Thermoleophilia bacterium]
MQVLLTLEWDVSPDREDEYSAFVARTFIPKCNEMGLLSVGGFYVEVGRGPRIISVKRVESLDDLARIMSSPAYRALVLQLKELVVGYRSKILRPTGRTRDVPYKIQKGVWKYNQYYDILPGKRAQYAEFITNEYLPMLDSVEYLEVTGGWNVLIGGVSEIIGELTFKDPVDIGALLENGPYRELTHVLRRDYVTNYSSRIM